MMMRCLLGIFLSLLVFITGAMALASNLRISFNKKVVFSVQLNNALSEGSVFK